MHNLQVILEIVIVGTALSVALYWASFFLGRLSTEMSDFKWWVKVILPQGIALAAALKIFKVF